MGGSGRRRGERLAQEMRKMLLRMDQGGCCVGNEIEESDCGRGQQSRPYTTISTHKYPPHTQRHPFSWALKAFSGLGYLLKGLWSDGRDLRHEEAQVAISSLFRWSMHAVSVPDRAGIIG